MFCECASGLEVLYGHDHGGGQLLHAEEGAVRGGQVPQLKGLTLQVRDKLTHTKG